jgi:hypothetical protein
MARFRLRISLTEAWGILGSIYGAERAEPGRGDDSPRPPTEREVEGDPSPLHNHDGKVPDRSVVHTTSVKCADGCFLTCGGVA